MKREAQINKDKKSGIHDGNRNMRSVKINRQSLYQSRRYTNNLPITGPREKEKDGYRAFF